MKHILLFSLSLITFSVFSQTDSVFLKSGEVVTGAISNWEDFRYGNTSSVKGFIKVGSQKIKGVDVAKIIRNEAVYQFVTCGGMTNLMKLIIDGDVKLYIFQGRMMTGGKASMGGPTGYSFQYLGMIKGNLNEIFYTKYDVDYWTKPGGPHSVTQKSKGVNVTNFYADKSNAKRMQTRFGEFFSSCKSLWEESRIQSFDYSAISSIIEKYNSCE